LDLKGFFDAAAVLIYLGVNWVTRQSNHTKLMKRMYKAGRGVIFERNKVGAISQDRYNWLTDKNVVLDTGRA
jgi:hypothetical protein